MPIATSSIATDARLPVTLLSGFLGAGKTTLLEHILKSKDHGLKCAVVVNDMGSINIDASLLANHNVTQKEEKVVQMENGCICCTLRGDLLEEIADLAEKKEFDYLIIESTGISEPMQVAETFSAEFSDQMAAEEIEASLPADTDDAKKKRLAQMLADGGLSQISRLDTCVTVVDCTTFLGDFDTVDFLSDRHGDSVTPEDERNITDLLIDQIEFANVILLNKTDLAQEEDIAKARGLITKLNPTATLIPTVRSRVDLTKILNTHLFNFEEAATGAGWLQSLKESNKVQIVGPDGVARMVPKPETEEYGIGSFVYRARRPFHPERLWQTISKPFVVIQNEYEEEEEEEEEESDEESDGDEEWASDDEEMDVDSQPQLDLPGRIATKRASPIFKSLLRSKGFAWLATRPKLHGEWSQAGVMFSFTGGTRWLCEEDESTWPMADDDRVVAAIKADFEGKWGDRRQEIVFIGERLDEAALTQTIDQCLLNDEEWRQWQAVMSSKKPYVKKLERLNDLFADGFEDWPDHEDDEESAAAAELAAIQEAEAKASRLAEHKRKLEEMQKHRGHAHTKKGKGKRV